MDARTKANAAEEGLLGLILLFDEFRRECIGENAVISADDFSTAFGRRVCEVIIELEGTVLEAMPNAMFRVEL